MEVANAARGVHLSHQTVAHLRQETSAAFVLPFLEGPGRRNLEAVKKGTVYADVTVAQAQGVHVHPPRGETNRGSLYHHRLACDLGLDDGESLGERVIREPGSSRGPQEVRQVVAGEPFAGLEGKPNQEREVFARAEAHLLSGSREESRATQTPQLEGMGHGTTPRFLDTRVVLGGRINEVSTR